jgi:hypothetical protein
MIVDGLGDHHVALRWHPQEERCGGGERCDRARDNGTPRGAKAAGSAWWFAGEALFDRAPERFGRAPFGKMVSENDGQLAIGGVLTAARRAFGEVGFDGFAKLSRQRSAPAIDEVGSYFCAVHDT